MRAQTNLRYIFSAILLLIGLAAFAQKSAMVTGHVTDEFGKPVVKAEVANLTNNFYAYTDAKGYFEIRGKKGDELKIRFQGKEDKVAKLKQVKGVTLAFDSNEVIAARKKAEQLKRDNEQQRMTARNARRAKRAEKKYNRAAKPYISVPTEAITHDKKGNPYKKSVIGQVIDEGGYPTPGVNVQLVGRDVSSSTDFDGYYGIDAAIGDELQLSYIGYKTIRVKVTDPVMNFTLEPDAVMLEEVVVVGYGTTTKKSVTASVTTVSARAHEGRASAEATGDMMISASPAAEERSVKSKSIERPGYKVKDSSKDTSHRPGQLTAGEVNDFSKWDYWEDLAKDQLAQWRKVWQISPTLRYSVVLVTNDGYPLVNKEVRLINTDGVKLWTARTDNMGKAELWYRPDAYENTAVDDELQIADDNAKVIISKPKEFHDGINTYVSNQPCAVPNKIDIAFMVDATGSMGDEISYLQAELYDVIERTKDSLKNINLRMGSVFYRDKGDEYVVKAFDLTPSVPDVISFIKQQRANGGGDTPEAATEAFETSIEMLNWRDEARTRLLFVVLDAPPHTEGDNISKLRKLAALAAKKGIRIIPVAASGIDKSTEYLMRAIALQTNGTYLFLTNHSGIGNDHIAPSTDSYKVEMLNDLLLRIILQMSHVTDCSSDNLQQNNVMEQQLGTNGGIQVLAAPNPTRGGTTITVNGGGVSEGLWLFDTTGKLLLYKDDKSSSYKINLSGFPDAVYYVKLSVEGKALYAKVIKQL